MYKTQTEKLSSRQSANEMRHPFERHFLTRQCKGRKVKSDPRCHIIYMKWDCDIFFTPREGGEQMSPRPTSGPKSPRRKISSRAYFWKCQGDASSWRSRQSHGWCHTAIPGDNPGYSGAGARVPVRSDRSCHCMYSSVRVHRRVLPRARVHTQECCTSWERLNAVDCMMDASGLT